VPGSPLAASFRRQSGSVFGAGAKRRCWLAPPELVGRRSMIYLPAVVFVLLACALVIISGFLVCSAAAAAAAAAAAERSRSGQLKGARLIIITIPPARRINSNFMQIQLPFRRPRTSFGRLAWKCKQEVVSGARNELAPAKWHHFGPDMGPSSPVHSSPIQSNPIQSSLLSSPLVQSDCDCTWLQRPVQFWLKLFIVDV